MEERLFFAEQIEDHGVTIGHHIQGKQWQQALDVMAQQHDPNSFYKHSPVLMKHLPGPTVSVLLQFTPGINNKGMNTSTVSNQVVSRNCLTMME